MLMGRVRVVSDYRYSPIFINPNTARIIIMLKIHIQTRPNYEVGDTTRHDTHNPLLNNSFKIIFGSKQIINPF